MRLRTILMTLILGASTAAVAQPYQPYQPRETRHGQGQYDSTRVITLESIRNRGGQVELPVGADKGRFERLQLRVDQGTVFVKRVSIEFMNHDQQRVNLRLGRRLQAGEVVDLDLQGSNRAIKRIVITTERPRQYRTRGSYSIVGVDTSPRYGWADHWRKHYEDGSYDRR